MARSYISLPIDHRAALKSYFAALHLGVLCLRRPVGLPSSQVLHRQRRDDCLERAGETQARPRPRKRERRSLGPRDDVKGATWCRCQRKSGQSLDQMRLDQHFELTNIEL